MNDIPEYLLGIIIPCGVFGLLGTVFTLIGWFMKRRTRDWDTTQGVIVKRGALFASLPDKYPTFQYVVDGQTYEHTSSVSQTPGFRPGSVVTVKYDPYQPERAAIDSIAQSGLIFLIIGLCMLGIAAVLLVVLLSLVRE